MYKIHIINYLIKKNNYKKYLEIGIDNAITFKEVKIDYKIGVDPNTSLSDILLNL